MLRFKGSIVALVTPFHEGKVDFNRFQKLVAWHVDNGTQGLVPCGTTGETPTLSYDEYCNVIKACIEAAEGRIHVIAGTGSNATEESIARSRFAEKAGADGILVVTPYYNKPTQEGLYQHYKTVAQATGVPMVLYNVPSRTGVDLHVETIQRLAELRNVVGLKDASPDLARPLQLRLALGEDFSLLSGEDATVAAYLAQGGDGCISVTANVAPRLCADLHRAWSEKNWTEFINARDRLFPLHQALFVETNPAPVKYCLFRLGRIVEELRLPLVPLSTTARPMLDAAMKCAGL